MKLLLVEDERIVRITVRDALEEAGYLVTALDDGNEALRVLRRDPFDLVLTDVRLPGADGLAVFREARRHQPEAGVVLMTAFADAADAVTVMREGARDYLQKPFEMDELVLRLGRVRDDLTFRRSLAEGARGGEGPTLIGDSPPMARLRDRVDAAAGSDFAVLITGETGTGKDLCARLVHERSARAAKPYVVVNCAALPETLLESEVFGHEKGAFTGAERRRVGRFEAADGGTLFLDEVGELSAGSQAKLLRVIETGRFEPVGSNRTVQVDVRIVAATNRDLAAEASRGGFRRDLFYRLNVVDVPAPPLRERRGDVPALAAAFLTQIGRRQGRPPGALEPAAVAALVAHDYPGNVRELLHALERAVALARGGPIRLDHLPPEMASPSAPDGAANASFDGLRPLGQAVQQFEQEYIRRALDRAGGHRGKAAALLGISRKSLWERLRDAERARDQEP